MIENDVGNDVENDIRNDVERVYNVMKELKQTG